MGDGRPHRQGLASYPSQSGTPGRGSPAAPGGSVRTTGLQAFHQIKTVASRDRHRKAKHVFSSEIPIFKGKKWNAFSSRHSEI